MTQPGFETNIAQPFGMPENRSAEPQVNRQNERLFRADGKPRRLGVVGYPLEHSLSPAFQNVAFEYHQLPHRYEKWEVLPNTLLNFVERAQQEEFLGLNLTLPHKVAGLTLVEAVTEEAQQVGAVNTLFDYEGQWAGANTDVAGFLEALQGEDYNPQGQRTLVLGAGGAARAAVYTLAKSGATEIAIANRTFERAAELADAMLGQFPQCNIYGTDLDPAAWPFNRNPRTLIVNATSQALTAPNQPFPVTAEALAGRNPERRTLFFDLTYGETPFLRAARLEGARTLDGLTMLVAQGAHSFELWTGRVAPRTEMLEAARAALAAKSF